MDNEYVYVVTVLNVITFSAHETRVFRNFDTAILYKQDVDKKPELIAKIDNYLFAD